MVSTRPWKGLCELGIFNCPASHSLANRLDELLENQHEWGGYESFDQGGAEICGLGLKLRGIKDEAHGGGVTSFAGKGQAADSGNKSQEEQ